MLDRLPPVPQSAVILVVDDEPENIQIVGSLLLKHGHEVITADHGEDALRKLENIVPDLILLDVTMPDISGFELCRIIRQRPASKDVPIIFLSAVADKNFVIEALESGGVDYITKPFHGPELLTRVDLHTSLQRTRNRLSSLIAEKNRLIEIVAHDLKNPLGGIQFAAMMLEERQRKENENTDPLLSSILESTTRAFEIVGSLLETRGLEEVKATLRAESICLKEQTRLALKNLEQHSETKNIRIEIASSDNAVEVLAEQWSLRCCLENLISNAIKFSPAHARIRIDLQASGDHGVFRVEDEGPGIRPDEMHKLFGKFLRLSARPTGGESSTGLGLHIVHELATAMAGEIFYEASSLGGACFVLKMPLSRPV